MLKYKKDIFVEILETVEVYSPIPSEHVMLFGPFTRGIFSTEKSPLFSKNKKERKDKGKIEEPILNLCQNRCPKYKIYGKRYLVPIPIPLSTDEPSTKRRRVTRMKGQITPESSSPRSDEADPA